MTNTDRMNRLYELLEEIQVYERSIGKLSFDLECCAPEEGMERAGEDMAILGKHLHKLTHAEEYTSLICALKADSEGLDTYQKSLVDHLYRDYSVSKNYTDEFAYEMDVVFNKAYGEWLNAKKAKDFSLFQDTLTRAVEISRKAISLRDERKETTYDDAIDDSERGMTTARLEAFFDAMKPRMIALIRRIVAEGKPIREDFMNRPVPIPVQEKLSHYLLELEGLRSSALVLMTTEHPFTDNYGPHDVRVTTHYYEDSFISNVFTTLHEGGHALFMQNEPEEVYAAMCDNQMSNGQHECISRFYENLIGRSEAFIHFIYPKLLELSGDTFSDVTERELYEAVNAVHPSLIRTEADELTYCLHILIRFELERDIMNGVITTAEIPALWNAKYKEYLGIDVPSDDVGCLQDVHWATGAMGYFPSYALGNAYGAQIIHTMKQQLDVDTVVANGELYMVRDWLKEHVFSKASILSPDEWIKDITGEELNVNYFLDYLEEKFTALYELK